MTTLLGHQLVGKRVKLRGHVWKVRYVLRNADGCEPWSGREWVCLVGDKGAVTTAWVDDLELISRAAAHPVNRSDA